MANNRLYLYSGDDNTAIQLMHRGGEQFDVDELIESLKIPLVREWLEDHWHYGISADAVTIKYEIGEDDTKLPEDVLLYKEHGNNVSRMDVLLNNMKDRKE